MNQTDLPLESSTSSRLEWDALCTELKKLNRRLTHKDFAQLRARAIIIAGLGAPEASLVRAINPTLAAMRQSVNEAQILSIAVAIRRDRSAAVVPLTEPIFHRFLVPHLNRRASHLMLFENYVAAYPTDYVFLLHVKIPIARWRFGLTGNLSDMMELLQPPQSNSPR